MQIAIDKTKQVDMLTGLKGIACFVVMLNHFAGVFYETEFRPWERYPLVTLFFNGTFMLYVFYILSGFFTAYSLFTKHDNPGQLGKRIFGRYFRLVIPVMAVCLTILIVQHLGFYESYDQVKNITRSVRNDQDAKNYYCTGTLAGVLNTALMCPLKSTTDFSFVFWMLPIIYRGFFVSLIAALLIRPVKQIPATALIVLGCCYYWKFGELSNVAFLAGVLFAYIHVYLSQVPNSKKAKIVGILCVFPALLFGSHWPNSAANNLLMERILNYIPDYVPLHIIGAASLFVCVVTLPAVKKILSTKLFLFLGKISFGVYLLHDLMQIAVGTNIFMLCYRLSGGISVARIAAFLSSTGCTLFCAFIFWKYIDSCVGKTISKLWSAIYRSHSE